MVSSYLVSQIVMSLDRTLAVLHMIRIIRCHVNPDM